MYLMHVNEILSKDFKGVRWMPCRYQYFGLEGGPPCFPQGFTCLVVLWIQSRVCKVSITGLSPSAAELSNSILLPHLHLMTVLNPGAVARSGLASFPFARRY